MSLVFLNADVVMLGFMRTEEEVGIYSGMGRLFILSMFVGHIVSAAFAPALAADAADLDTRRATYVRHIRTVVFLGAPVCAAIAAFPDWAILVVFGDKFGDGAPILTLLGIAAVLAYAYMAPLTALVSWRDQTAQMYILAAVAAANVGLNFWLIPAYGGFGAAIATLAAQALMFVLLIARVRAKFGLFGFIPAAGAVACSVIAFSLARIGLSARAPGSDAFAVWIMPLLMVFTGSAIYIAFAFAAGIIRRVDLTDVLYVLRNRDAANGNIQGTDIPHGQ